jgi:[acyl-carrier-protein] S-malonyltransferase
MAAAAERLGEALETTTFGIPWAPVVNNVTAQPTSDPDEIRRALLAQLTSPVRWVESVRCMARMGVSTTIEVGPKAVVSALIRRIEDGVANRSVTTAAEIASFSGEA